MLRLHSYLNLILLPFQIILMCLYGLNFLRFTSADFIEFKNQSQHKIAAQNQFFLILHIIIANRSGDILTLIQQIINFEFQHQLLFIKLISQTRIPEIRRSVETCRNVGIVRIPEIIFPEKVFLQEIIGRSNVDRLIGNFCFIQTVIGIMRVRIIDSEGRTNVHNIFPIERHIQSWINRVNIIRELCSVHKTLSVAVTCGESRCNSQTVSVPFVAFGKRRIEIRTLVSTDVRVSAELFSGLIKVRKIHNVIVDITEIHCSKKVDSSRHIIGIIINISRVLPSAF
jgi:hypothetical protein